MVLWWSIGREVLPVVMSVMTVLCSLSSVVLSSWACGSCWISVWCDVVSCGGFLAGCVGCLVLEYRGGFNLDFLWWGRVAVVPVFVAGAPPASFVSLLLLACSCC